MIKILLSGCCGKMGRVISDSAARRDDCMILAGIDVSADASASYPVYPSFEAFAASEADTPDVVIDFSHPSVLSGLLRYAEEHGIPAVIATTGLSEEQIAAIKELSEKLPVFFTANMSVGVNLLAALSAMAAKVLSPDFDIEIIEKHHNQKIDAPSGTALLLANEINRTLDGGMHYVYDRHSVRQKREKTEIGIHSIRGGTITGDHDVIFAGQDEVLTLSHHAASKEIFASGALNAALFLVGKENGLYDMKSMMSLG